MRIPRWTVFAVLIIALLLVLGRALASVYVNYRWYAAMDAMAVWREATLLSFLLRVTSGAAAAVFLFANLYAVRRSVVSLVLPRRVANIEIGEEVPGRYMIGAAAIVAVFLGALLMLPGRTWMSLALVRRGVPFGETDPYADVDLGFFTYWLPFENTLYHWALFTVLVAAAVVVFLYALTPSLRWEHGSFYVSNYVRRHLVVLGVLLLLLLAWTYRLDFYKVLINGSGPEGAFTYADEHAGMTVSLWLAILTISIAFVVLFFGWTGQARGAFVALSALLVIAFALRQFGPAVARHFADIADPELRERPYRQIRADYTRRAYALDRIVEADSLTYASAGEALESVSIWDPLALERSLERLRRVDGVPRAIGWSASPDGLLSLVVDGPSASGEIGGDGAPGASSAPWHVTRVRAAATDANGDPVTLAPPDIERDQGKLPPVLVYDSVPGYAIIEDTLGQIAAPDLGSGLSRLAHAWSLQNFHLLSADLARADVRILTRRGVRERIDALTPFFTQGTTMLPAIVNDSLYWIVDLYATSAFYPLSEHIVFQDDEFSYLHHAATAVVNAHTGRVTFLVDPIPDPIVRSWTQIFPALLGGTTSLPPAVAAAIPPAVDGIRVQALELARYGMTGVAPPPSQPGNLPWNGGADSVIRTDELPMFVLPRGRLAWSQPVVDSTYHVVGNVVGTGGRAGGTYWVPLKRPGARWNLLLEELRRAIDSTVTLPRDARLVHGATRAIPIAGSLALVQPAYAWKADAAPTLARIGIVRDSVVTTGTTLAQALGVNPTQLVDTTPAGTRDFRALVTQLYDEMHDALQRGDWVAFGRAYDELGKLIARMRR